MTTINRRSVKMSAEENEDDFDDVPLHRKKPFGSGLRRNEIKFVPASNEDTEAAQQQQEKSEGQSISDFYLSMVLKKKPEPAATHEEPAKTPVCEICSMPLNTTEDDIKISSSSNRRPNAPHEASIAHQVCLTHSHPPSALDRSRMGLSVLAAQGWDPDSRVGLGAAGQGTQYPIKPRPKEDRLGVGVVAPKDGATKKQKQKEKEKPKLLDAKKVRKMAAEDRKRADRLQREIFGRVDLEKYLGPGS